MLLSCLTYQLKGSKVNTLQKEKIKVVIRNGCSDLSTHNATCVTCMGLGVRSLDFHLHHLKFVVQKADGNISGLHTVAEIFK